MSGRLQGRRILITGAASGIGQRTAELFSAEGAALTLLDCDRKRLASVARETGGTAVEADVSQDPSDTHAVEQGVSAMGGIDGVVNPAGIVIHGSGLDLGLADGKPVLRLDLIRPYLAL